MTKRATRENPMTKHPPKDVDDETQQVTSDESDDDQNSVSNRQTGTLLHRWFQDSLPLRLASRAWERTAEMKEKKRAHQEALDERGEREEHIYATVLKGRDVNLERNLFPYACDEGIEHWTLWSRRDLRHDEIVAFVTSWCRDAAPCVLEWAYDENEHMSFDVPHVHVFFRRRDPALPPHTAEVSTSSVRKRARWDVPPSPLAENVKLQRSNAQTVL